MSEGSKSKARKFLSFDGKNLLAGVGLLAIMLMTGGLVAAQSGGTPDVTLDSNGVTINTGSLNVNGNDIEDAGTTIYDAASGEIPDAVLGIDLSTNAGNDLTWDSNNEVFNVDSSTIQSGTTASDVGLENVENEAAVAESGDTMSGDLDIGGGTIRGGISNFRVITNSEDIQLYHSTVGNGCSILSSGSIQCGGFEFSTNEGLFNDESITSPISSSSNDEVLRSDANLQFEVDSSANSGGPYVCGIDDSNGDFNCDGTKNWVHDLGNGSNAVYTSQESPEVRGVYEGQTTVENGATTVDLPTHFEKTVSDTEPMLRVQATPHELATVAVTERSDSELTIEASKDVMVDYRVTGIREGYEDKQVVRPKED